MAQSGNGASSLALPSGRRDECVLLTGDAMEAMLSHALTTEREEVMGLCVGHYLPYPSASPPLSDPSLPPELIQLLAAHHRASESSNSPLAVAPGAAPPVVVLIRGIHVIRRKDKRPDRVEVSDADLSEASHHAESLGQRVVGWYHSHPHITIHPSHVDVSTQALYQLMDNRFVGLIFSAFDRTRGRLGLIAFQSPSADSRPAPDSKVANPQTGEGTNGGGNSSPVGPAGEIIVPIHIVQEQDLVAAMGHLPIRSASISVLPGVAPSSPPPGAVGHASPQPSALQKIAALLAILSNEERDAYLASLGLSTGPGEAKGGTAAHPFVHLHSAATYQKALVRLMEYCVAPLVSLLQDRRAVTAAKVAALQAEVAALPN